MNDQKTIRQPWLIMGRIGFAVIFILTDILNILFLIRDPDGRPELAAFALIMATYSVAALVIAWRISDTVIGLVTATLLVMFAPYALLGVNLYWQYQPRWSVVNAAIIAIVLSASVLFVYLFPNGKFTGQRARWLALLLVVTGIAFEARDTIAHASDVGWAEMFIGIAWVLGIGNQIHRYLNVSGLRERQQAKWVLAGFISAIVPAMIWFITSLLQATWIFDIALFRIAVSSLNIFFPISIAIAILRYQLFDIDVFIRRTLIYGAITALLAGVYFSGVVILQFVFRVITGQESQLAVVISTLAIAALFTPLRKRVQVFVDRRFYRQKYDAERTLEAFSETMRDEVHLDRMTVELVDAVQKTMQPEHITLWMADFGQN